MQVGQPLHIQAGLAGFVRTKLFQQFRMRLEARHQIDADFFAARCKTGQHPVPFPAGSVNVVIRPKPDDAWPPHDGGRFGDRRHDLHQLLAIRPQLEIGKAGKKVMSRDGGGSGFGGGHSARIRILQKQCTAFAKVALRHLTVD